MTQTTGQVADEQAFEEVFESYKSLSPSVRLLAIAKLRTAMRLAWDAGMKRGEDKRGCCEVREAK